MQHSLRILGIIQILNPAYATAIAIASQTPLQVAIAHHETMPNNLNLVPTSVNLSPQQLFTITANIPPTIDTLALTDLVVEFFQIFELEFLVKNFEIFL
jgi:hypothetical protein